MPFSTKYRAENCHWLDLTEVTTADLQKISEEYGIDQLMLEDTVDPNHLPKYEFGSNAHFFLFRESTDLERATLNNISDVSTKMGVFLLPETIITIHRLDVKSIKDTEEYLRIHPQEQFTPDQIALMLGLRVIQSFDLEAQRLTTVMDEAENDIFLKSTLSTNHLRRLYRLKRKSGMNYRILNMSSDVIARFSRLTLTTSEIENLKDRYKDVLSDFDHLNLQATNLISMFLALSDQKANQVMKILAKYSVYFLPITFIAGVYGMNFDYMPELHHRLGYFAVLMVMAVIVILTFFYMKKNKF